MSRKCKRFTKSRLGFKNPPVKTVTPQGNVPLFATIVMTSFDDLLLEQQVIFRILIRTSGGVPTFIN